MYLVEVQGLSPAGAVTTFYFCSHEPGFVSSATDAPPLTVYESRVLSPGTFERHLWQPGHLAGSGVVSTGAITLANGDGALDIWASYDFDGRTLTILSGSAGNARSTFSPVLTGTIQSVAFTLRQVQINLRDTMAYVAGLPATPTRYLGNNVLPAGVEGTASDIGGKFKPRTWGDVRNILPPRVNSTQLIYQVSDKAASGILAVYEGGKNITVGIQRADVATLQANTPSAGHYDWSLGSATEGAYFKLGSSPALDITADVQEGGGTTMTIGQTCKRVLTTAGLAGSLVSTLAAFDTQQSGVVGYWTDINGTTVGQILDALTSSGGATWTSQRDGSIRIIRLDPPTSAAAATLSALDIIDTGDTAIRIIPIDNNGGIATYEIDVKYAHNWNIETGTQVAGAVAQSQKDWLGLDYRTVIASAPAIWNPVTMTGRNPLSQPMTITTELRDLADATTEASRLIGVYGTKRIYLAIEVPSANALAVDLGKTITLTSSRFGLTSKFLFVTGMIEDLETNVSTIFCWG